MNGVGLITVGRLLGHRRMPPRRRPPSSPGRWATGPRRRPCRTRRTATGLAPRRTRPRPGMRKPHSHRRPAARSVRSTAYGLCAFKIRPFARFASREGISGKQATRNAFGYPHRGLAQRILCQMRVARRRLDLRVSGQVLFGAEPWPVGLWQCKTLARRSASNNKQLLSLPRWLRICSCSMRFDEIAVDLARSEAVTCLCFVPWTFCGSGFPVPRAFRGFSPRARHTRPTPCSPPWPLLRIARHRWRTAAG